MEMERIIALYMDDCHSRQLRPKTMQSYEQALRLFGSWIRERHGMTQVEEVKDVHIRSYINDLQTRGKHKARERCWLFAYNELEGRVSRGKPTK